MRSASSLVMAGTLLESVVLQIVEAAVGFRPLRLGHARRNDELATMGAVEPGGQRHLLENDVDSAQADVGGQLRLLALVTGPRGDIASSGKANLSQPLKRVDALFARRYLAAQDGIVVHREVGRIGDVAGPGGRVVPDVNPRSRVGTVELVDSSARQGHDLSLLLSGILRAVSVEGLTAPCLLARQDPMRRGARDADQGLRVIAGDEDPRDTRLRRIPDLPHDRIVGAQNENARTRQPTDDHGDLGRRVAALSELKVQLLLSLVEPHQMNFGVVGQSRQAARSPLLDAKNDGRDERGQLGRSLELQALQNWNARVGGDPHVAENSRGDLLDPLIRCAFEHFDQRRDRVAPEPLQSLLGFRDRPGIAAPELARPGPRFRGVRSLLQAAGIPDGWRAPGPGPLVRGVTACAERQRYAKARKQADNETVGSGHSAPHPRRRVAPGARPVMTLWRRPRSRHQAFDLAAGRRASI